MEEKVLPYFSNNQNSGEFGIALPFALLVILFITTVGSIFSYLATSNLEEVKLNEATHDTFLNAEGVANEMMRMMSASPELWRQQPVLADAPDGYSEYNPLNYSSSNGIPSCSGVACHREMFPTGGGLLKNVGPLTGDGAVVDTSSAITAQLDPSSLPNPDITLNSQEAWVQVERLDETTPGASSVGGSLETTATAGTTATNIRFRITGTSFRSVKGSRGNSTVLYVIEIPST